MKVIMLKDVPKVGRRHDIKEVNDGYAVNFLFPKKLAEPATAKRLSEVEKLKQNIRVEREIKDDLLAKNLSALRAVEITVAERANESGHLFSGIKAEDIVRLLAKEHVEIEASAIKIERPIKEIGTYTIPVEIKGKKSEFTLVVVAL